MKKINVGIIGTGAIGPVHADAYVASAQANIVALCDINNEKLARHAGRLGVGKQYADYRDLLADKDVQAVSVCVPNHLHRPIAVAALQAGKHVLLEKPMAMNAREASEIVQAARKARRVLQIGMVNRQRPEVQAARKLIEDGFFGEIYQMRAVIIRRRGIPGLGRWFTTKKQSGGGPLIDVGVHMMDIAMYLSDLWKPTAVSSITHARFGNRMRDYRYVGMWAGPPDFDGVFDVEDYASGFVRFGRQAAMSIEIAWAANAQEEHYVEVMGDKAGVRVMDGKPLTILTEHGQQVADLQPKCQEKVDAFHVQAGKFAAACRGDIPPAATGQQGMTMMKLIDAIYASAKAGKEVAIK